MTSQPEDVQCHFSDAGEECDNEATGVVRMSIGGVAVQLPTCEECAEEVDAL